MQKLILKLNDRTSIEIQGDESQDVIRIAAFWQSIPNQCPVCQASLVFEYSTPQIYKYYKLKCTGQTPHTVNLSERTDKTGMYFDNRKPWETWRAGAVEESAGNNAANGVADQGSSPVFSERASLIRAVKSVFDDCRDRNIPGYTKVDLNILGRFSDQQLRNAHAYLNNLLNPPKPKDNGDDIPF